MHQPVKPLPKIWLMTDERNDAVLERAVRKLPRGSGIIFRHYHLNEAARAERFATLKRLARKRGQLILLAGHPSLAQNWCADGVHGREWTRRVTAGLLHSAPVHNVHEIRRANFNGADLFFLSPAFFTRSHPEAKPLNSVQLRRLVKLCDGPVILLGGMKRTRFIAKNHLNVHGWAAIGALS